MTSTKRDQVSVNPRDWKSWPLVHPATETHGVVRRDLNGRLWEWKTATGMKVYLKPWR